MIEKLTLITLLVYDNVWNIRFQQVCKAKMCCTFSEMCYTVFLPQENFNRMNHMSVPGCSDMVCILFMKHGCLANADSVGKQ